jgi:hypothetical protein
MPTSATSSIFEAIKSIQTPIQLAAFALALVVVGLLLRRQQRYSLLLNQMPSLSEEDRAKTILADMGRPVPPAMSADQYLRYRMQQNRFWTMAMTLVAVFAILAVRAVVSAKPNGQGNVSFFGINCGSISNSHSASAPDRAAAGKDDPQGAHAR